MIPEKRASHLAQWIEFSDWSIWGLWNLYNLGDSRSGAGTVVPIEHKVRFDPVTKHVVGAVITNRLDNGEIREVAYEQIGNQVAYLRCGGYSGPVPEYRGTPEENYHHGMYVGDNVVRGDTYDLTDPSVRMHIAGFENHLCRATCNGETVVGLLECKNPVIYEMCMSAYPGYSLLD